MFTTLGWILVLVFIAGLLTLAFWPVKKDKDW